MRGPRRFFTGLDLGQSHDFTALAVVERVESKGAWDGVAFAFRKMAALRLRHLERVPRGTEYPDVARRVGDVTRQVALEGSGELLVDATGVGKPVVDLLRRERLGCTMTPVVVTGGHAAAHGNSGWNVPKKDLIAGLQVALQSQTLKISDRLPDGKALVEEMSQMRVRVTAAGNEQYGAWREGTHDDLVFAVALACWGARRAYPGDLNGEAGWWRVAPEIWM